LQFSRDPVNGLTTFLHARIVLSNAAVRNDVQQISLRSTGISAIAEILKKLLPRRNFTEIRHSAANYGQKRFSTWRRQTKFMLNIFILSLHRVLRLRAEFHHNRMTFRFRYVAI